MKKLRVDFNRRDGEGRVITSAVRASGAARGETVLIYQQGEPETYTATIADIAANGRIVLDVQWAPKPWSLMVVVGAAFAAAQPQIGQFKTTPPLLAGAGV